MNRVLISCVLGLNCFFGVACSSISRQLNQANLSSEHKITITSSIGVATDLPLADLTKRFPVTTLTVHSNPAYKGGRKEYEGIDFATLLAAIDPDLLKSRSPFWFKITTLDGWTAPPYESSTLLNGTALLAIREKPTTLTAPISSDGLWSMVVTPKKQLYPGPFYLVWNDPGKNPDVMPLQVASIVIQRMKPEVIEK